jgi:hypothetical protein
MIPRQSWITSGLGDARTVFVALHFFLNVLFRDFQSRHSKYKETDLRTQR